MVLPSDDFRPAFKDRFLRTEYSAPLDYNDQPCENKVVFPDLTTPVTYSIQLSQAQWQEIVACILQGSIIIYPNDVQRIYWNFVRAVDCEIMDCQTIIDCLLDPESGVSTAFEMWLEDQVQNNPDITNIINGTGGNQSTPVEGNYTPLGSDCDLDILFGFTKQLTIMMNEVLQDFYQKLENATNALEAVPIYSQEVNAMAYALEYIEFVLNSVREAYFANYDLAYENEIACGLFCLAQENPNCELTWDDVVMYFSERCQATGFLDDLSTLLTFLATGTWIGTEWCDISIMTFAFIMRIGATWSGIDLSALQLIVSSFFNDPDPDWQTLCECGYEVLYDWNRDDNMGWNPVRGQWATFEALFSTAGTPPLGITVDRTFGTPFDGLRKVEVNTAIGGCTRNVNLTVTHAGGQDILAEPVKSGYQWVEFELPATRNGVSYIEFTTGTFSGCSVAYAAFRLSGIGDNPPPDP